MLKFRRFIPKSKAKSKTIALVLVGSTVALASGVASADLSADVSAALTQANTLIGLIAPGLITAAGLMAGVGLVIRWISK